MTRSSGRSRMSTATRRIAQIILLATLGAALTVGPLPLGAQSAPPIWSFGGYNLQRTNFTPKAGSLTAPHVAWRLNFETTASPASVSPPAVADLDGDGQVELVYGEGVRIVALERPWQRRRWEFSIMASHGVILMTPAVVDVDGDRRPEVFFAPYQAGGSTFYRLNAQGQPVWTFQARAYASYASPAVADLEGDGKFEVIFADNQGNVYILDAGTGRPKCIYTMGGRADMNAPAIADLDRDGKKEIIIGNHGNGYIHVIDSDCRPKWTYGTGRDGSIYGTSVDDADGDGVPEIYAADWSGAVHSLTAQGRLRWTVRTSAPVTSYNGLAIAPLYRDGTKQIVVGTQDGTILCLSAAGRVLWQFQRRGHISGSVIVGDFERSGQIDVLAGSHNGFLYLLGPQGALRWEYQLGGRLAYMGLTAEDIDGDGLVEVLVNNDDNLYGFSRPPAR